MRNWDRNIKHHKSWFHLWWSSMKHHWTGVRLQRAPLNHSHIFSPPASIRPQLIYSVGLSRCGLDRHVHNHTRFRLTFALIRDSKPATNTTIGGLNIKHFENEWHIHSHHIGRWPEVTFGWRQQPPGREITGNHNRALICFDLASTERTCGYKLAQQKHPQWF